MAHIVQLAVHLIVTPRRGLRELRADPRRVALGFGGLAALAVKDVERLSWGRTLAMTLAGFAADAAVQVVLTR